MAQVLEMVRTLQDNAAASKAEQERMQTELAASQSRNDELNRVNEELRRTLQAQRKHVVDKRVSRQRHHLPERSPCHSPLKSWEPWCLPTW